MYLKHLMLTALIASASEIHADWESSGNRFFVEWDFLYWNAHISDLELSGGKSSIVVDAAGGTTATYMNELDVDPHFKWNAGYRFAAGYQFDCSAWALAGIWTHFQDSGTRNISDDSGYVNTTRCQVKSNQIDLILAYDLASCFCLNFKPFLGIEGLKFKKVYSLF